MNRTLLLILCDFLLLNLLALTRWENAEPVQPQRTPVPEVGANARTREDDLVEVMKMSLADERASREQLAQQLSNVESSLANRDQNLAQLQAERERLTSTLSDTQRSAQELTQRLNVTAQEASMTKEQLARIQRELEEKRAEAERQQQALTALEQQQQEARQRIEGLSVAVKVAEQEKLLLRETAETFRQQAVAEREEREKVQATTVQLAQGVGQLAESSGQLTKEIRDNRPINANILFSEFLGNRVNTTFTAVRRGLFGQVDRTRETQTLFIADGDQIYALVHVADTPFSLLEPGADWERLAVEFSRPPHRSLGSVLHFLSVDPRVVAIPVDAAQAQAIGVKVYETALDPFKFPEAVLISGGGRGYGEVAFKLDPTYPGYVRVDNRLFKRLFGDFAPSRGDLVLSKTGELLGIMVNNDYCALVNNFLPSRSIRLGDEVRGQQTGQILDAVATRYRSLPLRLQ